MIVVYDHEGSCGTPGCVNQNVVFDVPTIDGRMSPMVCGVCRVDFTDRCTPKGE